MVYGDTYKQSLRIPSEAEHLLIEKAIPYITRQSRRKIEDATRRALISLLLPFVALLGGALSEFGIMVLCCLPTLFFAVLILVEKNDFKIVKHHVSKMHAGKYNVATGIVDHYSTRKNKCDVQGKIGSRSKSDIQFTIDNAFIEETDWSVHLSFVCVIVDQYAYVVAQTERGKPIVTNKVEIFSINTADYRSYSDRRV